MKKIIYFDEDSVTDYIQIVEGGQLERTTELLSNTQKGVETNMELSGSTGISRIFKALLGFEAKISGGLKGNTAIDTNKMVKNILQNTILTDFLDLIKKEKDNTEFSIKTFSGFNISVNKDSLSYIVSLTPYLSMLKDSGQVLNSGDFDLAIDKMDSALKQAKGYYEFIGIKDEEEYVFRFNIDTFKNNYKISDLLKMDLVIYAINVGSTKKSMLNMDNELNIGLNNGDNPSYDGNQPENLDDKVLEVYDVLLAGVE